MKRTVILVALSAWILALAPDVQAGLVNRYLMDDGSGTTVTDSIGTNDGTVKSGGSWTTGLFGDAWDGTSSGFISIPATGVPTTQGTFVQWAKISTTAGNWSNPLTSHFMDFDYTPYPLRHEIGGPTPCEYAYVYGIPNGSGNGGAASLATTTVVKDDAWHQWVTTYDNSTGRAVLYIDGVQRASLSNFDPTGVVLNPTWLVGARYESGGGRCPAVYDNTAVYDHALTRFEVHQLYNIAVDGVTLGNGPPLPDHPTLRHLYTFGPASHPEPNVVLDSAAGYDGLVNAGTWVADSPPRSEGGWQKSANPDYVQLPIQANLLEGTFEGWFKTDTSVTDWKNPFTTSIRDINEQHAYDAMRVEVVPGYNRTNVYDIPGAGTLQVDGLNLVDGQWHYLALTYEDSEPVKLYVDGVLAGTSTGNYDASAAYDRGYTMLGSRDIGGVEEWRGVVGSFAYHGVALPDWMIFNHFETGDLAAIPEPASAVLFAVGGLALAALGLRRRRFRLSP